MVDAGGELHTDRFYICSTDEKKQSSINRRLRCQIGSYI